MYIIYFLLNLILFISLLKFFLLIFKDKYIFPFRIAEIVNFLTNIFINSFLTIYFFGYGFLMHIVTINCCLAFIFYNMLSMVNTSSRTKILLDLLDHKKLDLKKYYKRYNEKVILENRIQRLKTNNEIHFKNNKIKVNSDGIKFFKLVIFVFSLLKKI